MTRKLRIVAPTSPTGNPGCLDLDALVASDTPPAVAVYVPILRAKAGLVRKVVVLNAGPEWYLLHRVQAHCRTYPCLGGPERCPIHDAPGRWYGYLGAVDYVSRKVCLAEITPSAWTAALAQLHAAPMDWRGMEIHLLRAGEHANSPVRVDVRSAVKRMEKAPAPLNVRQLLARVWFGDDPQGALAQLVADHERDRVERAGRRASSEEGRMEDVS